MEKFKTKKDITKWLKQYKIKKFELIPNEEHGYVVDVHGDVHLSWEALSNIPVQFNSIFGRFYCDRNELTSLEGCPLWVQYDFVCSSNKLTSLRGCPDYIGRNFFCDYNQLHDLKYCASVILDEIYCSNNKLTTLEGCPKHIKSHFYCYNNLLSTLEHCPEEINGEFSFEDNLVGTLLFFPKRVDSYVSAKSNPLLGKLQKSDKFNDFYEAHKKEVINNNVKKLEEKLPNNHFQLPVACKKI